MTPQGAAVHEALTRVWATPPGLHGWLAAVNHRVVGTRYVVTAFGRPSIVNDVPVTGVSFAFR